MLKAGRPAIGDAQSDRIAWITGWDVRTIAKVLPIATTVVLEILANACMFAAFAGGQPRTPAPDPSERPRLSVVPGVRWEDLEPDPKMVATMGKIRQRLKQ